MISISDDVATRSVIRILKHATPILFARLVETYSGEDDNRVYVDEESD